MSEDASPAPELESDPRFPSGPWVGFFLDKRLPGRHQMDLSLTFQQGVIQGDGRDRVGEFLIRGKYDVADGRCHWCKRYIGAHDIYYDGFNEGKGIWGTWELLIVFAQARGGFHIWPEGMLFISLVRTQTVHQFQLLLLEAPDARHDGAEPVVQGQGDQTTRRDQDHGGR